jgi:U3 small nucleolar RNA-associated protein 14
MKGVILNSVEERDKKFAHKFLVKELPHPFKNVKQFEALMSVPLGKDWNTIQSHKRLIQPEVLTKAGSIIKPLKYKKDLPLQTIE